MSLTTKFLNFTHGKYNFISCKITTNVHFSKKNKHDSLLIDTI